MHQNNLNFVDALSRLDTLSNAHRQQQLLLFQQQGNDNELFMCTKSPPQSNFTETIPETSLFETSVVSSMSLSPQCLRELKNFQVQRSRLPPLSPSSPSLTSSSNRNSELKDKSIPPNSIISVSKENRFGSKPLKKSSPLSESFSSALSISSASSFGMNSFSSKMSPSSSLQINSQQQHALRAFPSLATLSPIQAPSFSLDAMTTLSPSALPFPSLNINPSHSQSSISSSSTTSLEPSYFSRKRKELHNNVRRSRYLERQKKRKG